MTKSNDTEEIQEEEVKNEPKEYPCTDTGNMERFVDQHQGYLRSLGTIKIWLVWDGTRWKPSNYAEVFKFALETVQSIKTEVEQATGLTDAQNLKKWSVNGFGGHPDCDGILASDKQIFASSLHSECCHDVTGVHFGWVPSSWLLCC